MYTLDTNAIIYYFDGDTRVVPVIEKFFDVNAPLYISAVTVVELLGYPKLSAEQKDDIEKLFGSLFIIPVDMELARTAANLRSQYRLKTPDSLIAATALSTGTTLVIRNVMDFKSIASLKLWEI